MDVLVISENTLPSIRFRAWAFYGRIRYHKKFSCSLLYSLMERKKSRAVVFLASGIWCFGVFGGILQGLHRLKLNNSSSNLTVFPICEYLMTILTHHRRLLIRLPYLSIEVTWLFTIHTYHAHNPVIL